MSGWLLFSAVALLMFLSAFWLLISILVEDEDE